jgi:hypothetical protein
MVDSSTILNSNSDGYKKIEENSKFDNSGPHTDVVKFLASSSSNNQETNTTVQTIKIFSQKNLNYEVDEIKNKIRFDHYPSKRLICFKSNDNKNMIVYIHNYSKIIIEKDNSIFKTIESQDFIRSINNFKFNNIDYIMYNNFDGSIQIYNLDDDNTININNVFEKNAKSSLCTILDENNNINIFGCSESENYIKKCIYNNNINNISFEKYYPEEENNKIYYYFIDSFYSQKEKKYFIIFGAKSNGKEYKINSIDFKNKKIYNTYNYKNAKCDYFEIIKYNNEEYLFACYINHLICYNFHNTEIFLKIINEKDFKFKGISIYKEYIFLSGYDYDKNDKKSNTYIYIYKSKDKINEKIFDNLKITGLKISNEILVIYEKENETIKKFDINL